MPNISKINPNFDELFSSPEINIKTDWFNKELPFKIQFYLGYSSEKLLFGAKVNKKDIWKFPYKKNEFREKLWERDVVELFISETGQKNYLEINLDPNGAYWIMGFVDFRIQSTNFKNPKTIETYCDNTAGYWKVGLSLDLSELPFETKTLDKLELNICGIIGENQRYYLAYHNLPFEKPDFHRRDLIKKQH